MSLKKPLAESPNGQLPLLSRLRVAGSLIDQPFPLSTY